MRIMPEVGRYKLPVFGVDDAVSRLQKIRDAAGGRTASKEVAASAMGMSPTGGATWHVLAAMDMYGLVSFNGKEVVVTDLGEAAVFGDSNEVLASKVEAVKRVELLRELFGRYGPNPSGEQIRAFLRQYAQVELAKVPALVGKITKLLKQVSQYAGLLSKPGESKSSVMVSDRARGSESVTATPAGGEVDLMEVRIGSHYFRLPLDDLDMAGTLAKNNIDGIIASLKAKRKAEANEKKVEAETR